MLERINIRNYRSCTDTEIYLQPDLSVFIGPNGSGKTTLLTACLLLRKLTEMRGNSLDESEMITDESQIDALFTINDQKIELRTEVELSTDETNKDVILGSHESWRIINNHDQFKSFELPLWAINQLGGSVQSSLKNKNFIWRSLIHLTNDTKNHLEDKIYPTQPDWLDEYLSDIKDLVRFISNIKYYSASQFTNPSTCPISIEIEQLEQKILSQFLIGHSKFLFDLYYEYKHRSNSNFDRFIDVIGKDGVGLIDDLEFKEIPVSSIDYTVRTGGRIRKETREKILIIPQFSIGNNKLSPNQLSEGTFKTITLLFYVMTDQSKMLLIEEPEVCVHHGLLSSIIDIIKTYSQKKQILMSTHSDFVIDQVELRSIYKIVRLKEKGTLALHLEKSLPAVALNALKEYLETEGNLGEYWRHGGFD